MTEFLLVRHALPLSGLSDPGLGGEGHEQARRLGVWLQAETIDRVLCSPMRRAIETAEGMVAAMGVDGLAPVILEELRELGEEGPSGDEYIPAEEIPDVHPVVQALAQGRYEDVQPRHEWENFHRKAKLGLETLLTTCPAGRVAVVAHGGIINAMLAGLLGLPGVFWFYPEYTSITRIESLPSGRVVLRSVNEVAHLTAVRVPPAAAT